MVSSIEQYVQLFNTILNTYNYSLSTQINTNVGILYILTPILHRILALNKIVYD